MEESVTFVPRLGIDFCDESTWDWRHFLGFAAFVLVNLELTVPIITEVFSFTKGRIPMKASHLDAFERIDKIYLVINQVLTVIFVFHFKYFLCHSSITWYPSALALTNTVLVLPALFIVYDFFYCIFHTILHVRAIYGLVHKHHHRQHSPTRGYIDAANVHPFEFIVGEWLYMFVVFLLSPWLHGFTVIFFMVSGATMAALNHTRYDAYIPPGIYKVRYHDIHHRLPEWNMSQYTMFWDRLFGTFREANYKEV